MNVRGKRILVLTTDDYALYKPIAKNLSFMGFEVTTILNSDVKFKYKNIFQHLYITVRGLFDKSKEYKKKIKSESISKELITKVEKAGYFDYSLVLRSDFFHLDVLSFIKTRCKFMVSYHYDGLHRNPLVFDRIPIFDKFYAFDKEDVDSIEKTKIYLSNNFFFDYDYHPNSIVNDIYFFGFYEKSREKFLFDFFKIAKKLFKNPVIEIVFLPHQVSESLDYKVRGINCLTSVVPFEKYLERIEQSNIIMDFLINAHNGLSFRIFEGLKYNKKVITTNPTVVNYDFYHPHNLRPLQGVLIFNHLIMSFLICCFWLFFIL